MDKINNEPKRFAAELFPVIVEAIGASGDTYTKRAFQTAEMVELLVKLENKYPWFHDAINDANAKAGWIDDRYSYDGSGC